MTDVAPPPPPVYSLICQRDLEHLLICLASFEACCRDEHRLLLVNDGSLDSTDLQRVFDALPRARLIPHEALDAVVDPLLRNRPYCRWFRELHAWGRKLIDIPCHAGGQTFAFVDSDVLFIRPFEGLFDPALQNVAVTFMHSYANILSIKWTQRFASWWRYPLADRCNSGLLAVGPSGFSLDTIEAFLASASRHPRVLLAEQTAWAVLAARGTFAFFDPAQVRFPLTNHERPSTLPDAALAYHFIGGTRHQLKSYVNSIKASSQKGTLPRLHYREGRRLGVIQQLFDTIRLRARMRRWRANDVFR